MLWIFPVFCTLMAILTIFTIFYWTSSTLSHNQKLIEYISITNTYNAIN